MAASKGNAAGQTEAKLYKSHRAIFFLHVPVTPSVHKKVTHRGHQWGPSLWAFESSHQCRKLSTGSAAVGILMVWVMWPPSMGILGLQRTCGAGQDGAAEQNTAASCQQGSLDGGRLPGAISSPCQACLVSWGSRHGQVSGNKCFKSLILLPAK